MRLPTVQRLGASIGLVLLIWLSLTAMASVFVTTAKAGTVAGGVQMSGQVPVASETVAAASNLAGYTLNRLVVVMRHGIRPPTKAQVISPALSDKFWPTWDVPFGHLTRHGEAAVAQLGAFDAVRYCQLLTENCSQKSEIPLVDCSRKLRIIADTDQRTLKTAEVYAQELTSCPVKVERAGEGQPDPRFSPFDVPVILDEQLALKSARDALAPRDLSAVDEANRARLDALSDLLSCNVASCRLSNLPTRFVTPKGRVKIDGGIDAGSTLAQVLMLQYVDAKPLDQVGWGLVDKAQIRDLLTLHALEFELVARPRAIAEFGARALLRDVRAALYDASQPAMTVFVGHDSNLAYVGGALGLHWQGGDFPDDDPPPGGAILIEKWSNTEGAEKIVVRFRAQTLDEMRNLTPPGADAMTTLLPAVCGHRATCEGKVFKSTLDRIIGP